MRVKKSAMHRLVLRRTRDASSSEIRSTVLRRNIMRNWCLATALVALFALPVSAQQTAGGLNDDAARAAEKSAPASSEESLGGVAFSKDLFAVPAAAQPKAFPQQKAAKKNKDTRAPGQLVPRFEVAGMYNYINFAPGKPFANFNSH